jgi:transcription elongation factor GreA
MNTTITSNIKENIKEKTILLSKKGMKELRKAVAQLEHDRQMILKGLRDLSKTTSHDDRLDRIERLAQLESVENELNDKHYTLTNAQIIPSRRARLQVAIGSVVDLIDQQGRLFRYTLVDSIEANPSDGRISISSPLGQNLLGKTVKDIVEWSAGLHIKQARLISVS